MKTFLAAGAWAIVAVAILYAALNPNGGLIDQGPVATLGLGLIGVGLFREARQRYTAIRIGDRSGT